jgi:hypothetical protein
MEGLFLAVTAVQMRVHQPITSFKHDVGNLRFFSAADSAYHDHIFCNAVSHIGLCRLALVDS